ncbi:MAG: hypothetical protein IJZ56_03345 [Oscillospiraceae bacterium]|nr:hypothetical protein [Oscillospiraceae bacterium]
MYNDIWKRQAINDLEMYGAKKRALINIPAQIKELEEKLISIRSQTADSVSVKGGGGSRDDAYLNNIVARDRLSANLEETRRYVSRIDGALSILTAVEMELLDSRWISKEENAVSNLARRLDKDPRTINRMINEALFKFTTAMYG